jgi:hypothetical protein
MATGLLAILAPKGKGAKPPADADDEAPASEKGESDDDTETAFAREAFAALRDGDEDGFVDAFKGAVRACVDKAKGGEYDEPES